MKAKPKNWFLWSSLGGLAVGAAVAWARRGAHKHDQPLACRKIPHDCPALVLWTEQFAIEEPEGGRFAHDRYYLQPTRFKVWRILDLSPSRLTGGSRTEGAFIYHVSHVRVQDAVHDSSAPEEEHLLERFYGVITVVDSSGAACGDNAIARGGILEINKCYVGGSDNGVETGEIHRAAAPILNYRIEYQFS